VGNLPFYFMTVVSAVHGKEETNLVNGNFHYLLTQHTLFHIYSCINFVDVIVLKCELN
jgi:hypothetical protein